MRTAIALAALAVLSGRAAAQDLKYVGNDEYTIGSTAVVVGDVPLVHTAQFLPVDTRGNLVKGNATAQATYALADALAAVGGAGGDPEKVVRLNVCAANIEAADAVRDAIRRRYDTGKRPAVTLVLGKLPVEGALVGIDAVAPVKGTFDAVKLHRLADFPTVAGGSHAAVLPAGRRVYISGQAEKGDTPAEATRKTLASLRNTLKWLGLDDSHVVQCKSFLKPVTATQDVTSEFVSHFGEGKCPPLVFVEWESTLPIEIELIATAPGDVKAAGPLEFLTPPGMTASPVYSRVTRVKSDRFIYTCGLVSAKPGSGEGQVNGAFGRLRDVLKETGGDLNHLVKATYYVSNDDASTMLNKLRPNYYDPKRPPAASKAVVAGTGVKDRTLITDLIAVPGPPS
jgi:enamine deaminase RidA (YjgF/YER057c/UK114 family)